MAKGKGKAAPAEAVEAEKVEGYQAEAPPPAAGKKRGPGGKFTKKDG